ncbi:MAG: MBL fold metallo-hydrolase [candidate division NC10 bacterium]|nr:MBL fold metallo-hydrolase [candidate division NC10 bacterium]
MGKTDPVVELRPGIFRIRGLQGSSHSYVIKGEYKNVLVDSGADRNFPMLREGLLQIGLKVKDIDILINTHEHSDHIGANRYFEEYALVAAYRLAASKMAVGDTYVTMYRANDLNEIPQRVHLWLENMTRIDLGNYSLRVLHTPGHTSGSICLYEATQGLLFSADTLFAGGTLSYIAESGSVGDYLDSLRRLSVFRIAEVFPGHGRVSTDPQGDIARAIANAQALLQGEKRVEGIFYQKESGLGVVEGVSFGLPAI